MSITDVARDFGVDWRCVKDAEKECLAEKYKVVSLEGVEAITIDEMIQMAKTVERHLSGILGYWDFDHASSGSAEGFNTKIRLLIKQSYGIRDFKYLRLKIHDLPSRRIKTHI